jgi:hypothetical protein
LASTDPTAPVVTVQCELGNCHRCRGQVISLLAPTGQPCTHDCHAAEAERAGKVA